MTPTSPNSSNYWDIVNFQMFPSVPDSLPVPQARGYSQSDWSSPIPPAPVNHFSSSNPPQRLPIQPLPQSPVNIAPPWMAAPLIIPDLDLSQTAPEQGSLFQNPWETQIDSDPWGTLTLTQGNERSYDQSFPESSRNFALNSLPLPEAGEYSHSNWSSPTPQVPVHSSSSSSPPQILPIPPLPQNPFNVESDWMVAPLIMPDLDRSPTMPELENPSEMGDEQSFPNSPSNSIFDTDHPLHSSQTKKKIEKKCLCATCKIEKIGSCWYKIPGNSGLGRQCKNCYQKVRSLEESLCAGPCKTLKTSGTWYKIPGNTGPERQCEICYKKTLPLIERLCAGPCKTKMISGMGYKIEGNNGPERQCQACYKKTLPLIEHLCAGPCKTIKTLATWHKIRGNTGPERQCASCYQKARSPGERLCAGPCKTIKTSGTWYKIPGNTGSERQCEACYKKTLTQKERLCAGPCKTTKTSPTWYKILGKTGPERQCQTCYENALRIKKKAKT